MGKNLLPHPVNDTLPHLLQHPCIRRIQAEPGQQHEKIKPCRRQDSRKIKPAQFFHVLSGKQNRPLLHIGCQQSIVCRLQFPAFFRIQPFRHIVSVPVQQNLIKAVRLPRTFLRSRIAALVPCQINSPVCYRPRRAGWNFRIRFIIPVNIMIDCIPDNNRPIKFHHYNEKHQKSCRRHRPFMRF